MNDKIKGKTKDSEFMKKIDLHCHILPGLDDGAKTMEESLKLLKDARKQEILSVVATPHYSPRFRNEDPEQIKRLCKALEEKAREVIDPDFRIYEGQEIFYTEDVLQKLEKGEILTIAKSPYLLLEFLPQVPYSQIYRAVRQMVFAGYRPILAHVERYMVLREPGRVDELREIGAYLQMNYRRIGGKWYNETVRWCRKMLKQEKIHFLATDMHDIRYRYPATEEAELWMQKHLEMSYRKRICFENAERILKINKNK